MNIHGRKSGIVETHRRVRPVLGPWHEDNVPLTFSQTENKWLIFEQHIYCIRTMESTDYEKFVKSHIKNPNRRNILTDGIESWDEMCARWSSLVILLKQRKITLYDSRQEAERAMEGAA